MPGDDLSSITGGGYELSPEATQAAQDLAAAPGAAADKLAAGVQGAVDAFGQSIADAEAAAVAAAAQAARDLAIALAVGGLITVGAGALITWAIVRGAQAAAPLAPYALPFIAPELAPLGPLMAHMGGGARPASDPLALALVQAQAYQRALPTAYSPAALPAAPFGPSRVEQLLGAARAPSGASIEVGSFRGRVPMSGPATQRTG